ncbi:transglutaminase TgpA family protein [Salibacterium sp. K-3]
MQRTKQTPRIFLMYVLGYLLLMEWLIPLPDVTNTGYVPVFMAAAAFFFLVMFLQFPWWAGILLMTAGMLFSIHMIFLDYTLFAAHWWEALFHEVSTNVGYMLDGQWYGLSDMFRSLLFLLLLAIMSYLLYFWIVHARRVLFFFLFTVIYIGVMDTFFIYDGNMAAVRVFILGFVLLALLQWDRLVYYFPGAVQRRQVWFRWTMLALFFLAVSSAVGIAAPKAQPQWPDPVPFMEQAAGIEAPAGNGGNTVQKIGYGENDERLGGGFEMDETPVFTASGGEVGYWRGESKNVYTGLGWESDTPHETEADSNFYEESVPVEEQQVTVQVAEEHAGSFDFAFYPGSLREIEVPDENVSLQVDRYSGRASTFSGGEPHTADRYTLTYGYPEFPIEQMQQTPMEDPEHIREHFLGLPDDLPSSIAELTEEITAEEDNRYDKVRAVERYLNSPEFTYDTSNIAVPEEGGDYVEQFLFDTKRGYCDNFSTSMAVMLRTLDIPTRWVKGFTKGSESNVGGENTVYEVTSANAHSWVEVYFPGTGWVPFEPTRGFASEFDYTYEEPESGENSETSEGEEEQQQDEEESTDEEEEQENEEDNEASASASGFPLWPFAAGGVVVLAGLLYAYRFTVIKKGMLLRFRHAGDAAAFTRAFHSLLRLLRHAGWERNTGETLREYGRRMDGLFGTYDMSRLVQEYEQIHYGGRTEKESWNEVVSVWADMVQRIKA